MDEGRREGKKETMNKEEGINWKKSKCEREVRKDGPACYSIQRWRWGS